MNIKIEVDYRLDFKTRLAGEKLRHQILQSIKKNENIFIEFGNVTVASISFFDEAIIKLADEHLTLEQLQLITLANLFRRDLEIIQQLAMDKKFDLTQLQISTRKKIN